MSKSKERKIVLGQSRPTENRATNAVLNEQILEWLEKVREAGNLTNGEGVGTSIDRVADVLVNLIKQTQAGKYPREVISGLVKRIDVQASLAKAQQKWWRESKNE